MNREREINVEFKERDREKNLAKQSFWCQFSSVQFRINKMKEEKTKRIETNGTNDTTL